MYVGVSGKAESVSKLYVGVGGKAKKITKGYIGVGGKAKLFYMSEISYVGSGTVTGDWGASTVTVPYPSGIQAGDLLILLMYRAYGMAAPSGWTHIRSTQDSSLPLAAACTYYKYHDTGSSVNVALGISAGSGLGVVFAFRGTASSSPINANTGNEGSGGTATFNGITTTVDNCVVCACGAWWQNASGLDTTNFSSWSNANLTGLTEAIDTNWDSGSPAWPGMVLAYGTMATAGATGNITATTDGDTGYRHCGITFAIAPAT
jgi:hypothetical protein